MNKTYFLLLGLVFSLCTVRAQQSTFIGISGGTNFSAVNGSYFAWGNETTLIKNRTGMQLGFIFDYPLTESLSLFVDPEYIQKGFKYQSDNELIGGPSYSGENKFQYIQLPLTIKLSLSKNKLFYVRSGLYLSFLLNAHLDGIYNSAPNPNIPSSSISTDEKINNDMNASTLGFVMGTGADIPLSSRLSLMVDAAYLMDVSNAMKDKPSVSIYPGGFKSSIYQAIGSVRNRSFSLAAGLAIKI